jgi:uncharacterized protein YcfL
MKTFLLSISIMFLLVGCQAETSQDVVPEVAKVARLVFQGKEI